MPNNDATPAAPPARCYVRMLPHAVEWTGPRTAPPEKLITKEEYECHAAERALQFPDDTVFPIPHVE